MNLKNNLNKKYNLKKQIIYMTICPIAAIYFNYKYYCN